MIFFFVSCLLGVVFTPISQADYDTKKALLGKKLFFDNTLSVNKRSCQSCHHLKGELTGTTNDKNSSSSILNSSLNFFVDSNGNFQSLKDQIVSEFYKKGSLNTDPSQYLREIKKNPKYLEMFEEIYGDLHFSNVVDALNEFIIALRSPARFDDYLLGDENALSDEEKEGFKIFMDKGCSLCHSGANLGGAMSIAYTDINNNQKELKIPSLRNVAKTKPWTSIYSDDLLDSIIIELKKGIIGVDLSYDDIKKIIKFFESLNSKVPSILEE